MTPQPPKPRPGPVVFQAIIIVSFAILVAGSLMMLFWPYGSGRAEFSGTTPHPSLPNPARDDLRAERTLQRGREALRRVEESKPPIPNDERAAPLNEAIEAFTEYLKHRPKYAPVLYDRARAYDLAGRIVEAVEDYEAAAAADPSLARSLIPRIATLRGLLLKK
ncbi:MAG TPA: hypothetical protein VGK61_02700 [Planctomycetota bacterium]